MIKNKFKYIRIWIYMYVYVDHTDVVMNKWSCYFKVKKNLQSFKSLIWWIPEYDKHLKLKNRFDKAPL